MTTNELFKIHQFPLRARTEFIPLGYGNLLIRIESFYQTPPHIAAEQKGWCRWTLETMSEETIFIFVQPVIRNGVLYVETENELTEATEDAVDKALKEILSKKKTPNNGKVEFGGLADLIPLQARQTNWQSF